jgi:rubrerythrin
VSLEGTPTADALREAVARQAQAALRCLYFARRADVEGRADVAASLRALADGEAALGFGHLEFLEEAADPLAGGGDTRGNLQSAAGEADANAAAYEQHRAAARKARSSDAADWFHSAALAEQAHVAHLARLLLTLDEE